jgi:PPOX class probable F420-dependent enzyme
MSIRLSEEEIQAFLGASHTGILSTLRRDGSPAVMPLWFVVVYGSVFVRTLAGSHKAAHLRRDSRVSFMVESGAAWAELTAVVIHGRAVLETDPELLARVDQALAAKYERFGMPAATPGKTREHYAAERVHARIVPEGRILTWDNSKLLRGSPG